MVYTDIKPLGHENSHIPWHFYTEKKIDLSAQSVSTFHPNNVNQVYCCNRQQKLSSLYIILNFDQCIYLMFLTLAMTYYKALQIMKRCANEKVVRILLPKAYYNRYSFSIFACWNIFKSRNLKKCPQRQFRYSYRYCDNFLDNSSYSHRHSTSYRDKNVFG